MPKNSWILCKVISQEGLRLLETWAPWAPVDIRPSCKGSAQAESREDKNWSTLYCSKKHSFLTEAQIPWVPVVTWSYMELPGFCIFCPMNLAKSPRSQHILQIPRSGLAPSMLQGFPSFGRWLLPGTPVLWPHHRHVQGQKVMSTYVNCYNLHFVVNQSQNSQVALLIGKFVYNPILLFHISICGKLSLSKAISRPLFVGFTAEVCVCVCGKPLATELTAITRLKQPLWVSQQISFGSQSLQSSMTIRGSMSQWRPKHRWEVRTGKATYFSLMCDAWGGKI